MITFEIGKVEVTPGAVDALKRNGQVPGEFISRHVRCDWGEVPTRIATTNNKALDRTKRIMSTYRMKDGHVLWVVTAADRSSTKVLLPWESVLTAAATSQWRAAWTSFWRYSAVKQVVL
ncbi:MAG: hypothetical protein PVI86_04530 [Phycisphaerae bacterium]